MARPNKPPGEKKKPITVGVGPRMRRWVENQVGEGKRWESKSEAFRKTMEALMKKEGALLDPEPKK